MTLCIKYMVISVARGRHHTKGTFFFLKTMSLLLKGFLGRPNRLTYLTLSEIYYCYCLAINGRNAPPLHHGIFHTEIEL